MAFTNTNAYKENLLHGAKRNVKRRNRSTHTQTYIQHKWCAHHISYTKCVCDSFNEERYLVCVQYPCRFHFTKSFNQHHNFNHFKPF